MATIITHPVVPALLGRALGKDVISTRLLIAACVASMLPDLDVIAFSFGIPYGSPFGHRGFSHSIVFATVIGLIGAGRCGRLRTTPWTAFTALFLATASHGVLDAMTDGGLGIAFFWPVDNSRYFFSIQPLEVSPIGLSRFLTPRGLSVLASEMLYVWLPASGISLLIRLRKHDTSSTNSRRGDHINDSTSHG